MVPDSDTVNLYSSVGGTNQSTVSENLPNSVSHSFYLM